MSYFTEIQYQRAFDKQSLGKISFIAELPQVIFEIDTNIDYTYVGYLTKQEKDQNTVFHRKIEFKRALIETNQGLFLVAMALTNQAMSLSWGSGTNPLRLKKLIIRFFHTLGLLREVDYHQVMISHNSDHYFYIYHL